MAPVLTSDTFTFMLDSVGKRLAKARTARGLTVEDAAHATRMRPDKIIALENDDYSRFGGNAYAKGFLLIYSRFLKVEAAEEARALETPKHIALSDYQYLATGPAPVAESSPRYSQRSYRQPNRPSVTPLLVSVIVIVGSIFGYYVYVQASRITGPGSLDRPPTPPALGTSAPPELPANAAPARTTLDSAPPAEKTPSVSSSDDAALLTDSPQVIKAEPINGTAVPAGANAATGSALPPASPASPVAAIGAIPPVSPLATPPTTAVIPSGGNEISIGVKKKTWVKICKDDPNSRPIFTDYLYPGDGPLKLPKRGIRFYIEAQDPSAIEVRKNGALIAYQPGTSIQ